MKTGMAVALIGMAVLTLSGAHMVLRPQRHLGLGTARVASPRTVRRLGIFFLVLGTVALALTLYKFVTE